MFSSVDCPALKYFSTLSHKRHDLRRRVTQHTHTMYVLILSTTLAWNIFHSKKNWEKYYDKIYLLTAIGLSPGGCSTVHIYTQTIHRTIQNKQYTEQHNNLGECGPCPVLATFTLAFALQLRKKHGKTSVRVAASKNISTIYEGWNFNSGNYLFTTDTK